MNQATLINSGGGRADTPSDDRYATNIAYRLFLCLGLLLCSCVSQVGAAEDLEGDYSIPSNLGIKTDYGAATFNRGDGVAGGTGDIRVYIRVPQTQVFIENDSGTSKHFEIQSTWDTNAGHPWWRQLSTPPLAWNATLGAGASTTQVFTFQNYICTAFHDPPQGNWNNLTLDGYQGSDTVTLTLLIDGQVHDQVTVTFNFDLQPYTYQGGGPINVLSGDTTRVEFSPSTTHAPPGVDVELDLEVHNQNDSAQTFEVGYFDSETQTGVTVHSETIPAGSTVVVDDTVEVPPGQTLFATLDLAIPEAVEGSSSYLVSSEAGQVWSAVLSFGGTLEPIAIGGTYRVLAPVSGTFELKVGERVIETVTIANEPSVSVPLRNVYLSEGELVNLNLKNLTIDSGESLWYGFDTIGNSVPVVNPGVELFEGGSYFFDFAIIGVEAGEIVADGTSTITESERVEVQQDGSSRTFKVYSSEVTRSDSSTYSTVLDSGSGTQIAGTGSEPFSSLPGATEAFENATLEGIKEQVTELNERDKADHESAAEERKNLKDYLNSLNPASLIADAEGRFGTSAMSTGTAPQLVVQTLTWSIPFLGTSINLDPAEEPLAVASATIIKDLIVLIVTCWFFWYVLSEIYRFQTDLSKMRQMQLFPITAFGNSIGAFLIPLVIAVMIAIFTTAPAIVAAAFALQDGDVASWFSTWTQQANTGETSQRVSYLLSFFIPVNFIIVTTVNAFGFIFLKTYVFKIYQWVMRMIPAS